MATRAASIVRLVVRLALISLVCSPEPNVQANEASGAHSTPSPWRFGLPADFSLKSLIKFDDFKANFKKTYDSESEESLRHALFSNRMLESAKSAMLYFARKSDTFSSLNGRSDMTAPERDQLLDSKPDRLAVDQLLVEECPEMVSASRAPAPPPPPLPGSNWDFRWFSKVAANVRPANSVGVDLRATGCFHEPPGDQGACHSCASFVAIAQLEYLRCRETGKLEKFSEQFPVDCGGAFGMMGCSGTDVHSLNKFISQVGLDWAHRYPYLGRQRRCRYYKASTGRYNFKTADTLKLRHEGIMAAHSSKWSKLLEQKIPLHVGVLINREFEDYGGGVASSCAGSSGAHGMLLVGEGRENGADFWLLRNSYGTWGLKGYFKLNKRANQCISDNGMAYFPAAFIKTFGSSFVRNLHSAEPTPPK